MRTNRLRIKTARNVLFIFRIIIGLGLPVSIQESSSLTVSYYPPIFFHSCYLFIYFPIAMPQGINPSTYLYPIRKISLLPPGRKIITLLTIEYHLPSRCPDMPTIKTAKRASKRGAPLILGLFLLKKYWGVFLYDLNQT